MAVGSGFITMLLTGFIAPNISCIFWPQLIQQILVCGFCLAFDFCLGFGIFATWLGVCFNKFIS